MKRTTILLPDELASFLDRERRRRGVSLAEVIREALADHFNLSSTKPRRLRIIGLGSSGVPDLGTNDEYYLDLEWGSQEFYDQTMGRYGDASTEKAEEAEPRLTRRTSLEAPGDRPADRERGGESASGECRWR